MPYVTVLAEFREQVRKIALETNSESIATNINLIWPLILCHLLSFVATPLLKTCDQLRDETLVELGVRLEDKEGQCPGHTVCLAK